MLEVGSPFGSVTRTRALLALELLGQSYPRELSRLLRTPLSVVQKALQSLERDALVAARFVGRTRVYQLDPRYFAKKELRAFLAKLLVVDDALKSQAAETASTSARSALGATGKAPEPDSRSSPVS